MSQISRFDVGGAVQAQIRADNSINFGGIFVVECGSVSSAGSIVLENNSILRVLATGFGVNGPIAALTGNIGVIETQNGGPLLADVNADMGSINQILVDGEIGSTSTSPLIRAMDGINTIDAAAIYATITSNAGGVGGVRRVRTTSGPFVGALNAYRIESATATDGLRITGNLDANVTIADNVLRPIVITGELKSGRTLSIAGQMITATTPSTTGSLDIGTLRGTVRFTRTTQGVRGPVTIDSIASTGRLESSSPLESGTNGSITVDGNMAGLVQVSGSVAGAITIGGELDGRVTTTGSLTGALTIDSYMDGLIKVGDNLSGTIDINQSQGLRGQIIINADNMSTPGTWTGPVIVGSITLDNGASGDYTAPYYNALPSVLGGGSVGLAPFRIHEAACSPPPNTFGRLVTTLYSSFDDGQVGAIVRHYGPIENTGIIVGMRMDTNCNWYEALSSIFDPVLHPGGDLRAIGITCNAGMAIKEGIWRIVPDDLACSEVVNNPAVVWQTTDGCAPPNATPAYVFEVGPDCNLNDVNDHLDIDIAADSPLIDDLDTSPMNDIIDTCDGICACDWEHDGDIDVPDIFAFLTSWFAVDPSADFDASGTVAVPDIFAFLSCWFASASNSLCNP